MNSFPRLYARRLDGPIFELCRGSTITHSALNETLNTMGPQWHVWIENAMVAPVGRTEPRGAYVNRELREQMLREELSALPDQECPVTLGRFY